MPAGRPSKFTQALADKICSELAEGRSLRSVCKDDGMPEKTTVFRWLRKDDEFRNQYARAKEESADAIVDEMLDIADDATNDWMEKERKDGSTYIALDQEHVQRSRLRIDTRKWISSKLKPKRYGESSQIALTGVDGGPIEYKALPFEFPDSAATEET